MPISVPNRCDYCGEDNHISPDCPFDPMNDQPHKLTEVLILTFSLAVVIAITVLVLEALE